MRTKFEDTDNPLRGSELSRNTQDKREKQKEGEAKELIPTENGDD